MNTARFWRRNGWSAYHAVGAVLMTALGVALVWPAWADMLRIALRDEEHSHIFLVPIVSAWLIWVRRERFRLCEPTGQMIGPIIIAIGWGMSAVGFYNAVQVMYHAGAPVVLVGCLVSALGWDVCRRFLPAFVVLVFLVPMPPDIRLGISLPMQSVLSQMVGSFFDVVGVPIVVQGNAITINGEAIRVAEECNGLRMVFALMLVSYAFAFGTPMHGFVRALIVAASPVSALVFNFIRMIPTVWLYGYSSETVFGIDGRTVADRFHDVAGWVMLVIAFLTLMSIIRALRWALVPVQPYTLAAAE